MYRFRHFLILMAHHELTSLHFTFDVSLEIRKLFCAKYFSKDFFKFSVVELILRDELCSETKTVYGPVGESATEIPIFLEKNYKMISYVLDTSDFFLCFVCMRAKVCMSILMVYKINLCRKIKNFADR